MPSSARYRCTSCGNLTRFDVTTSRRTRAYHHFTVGGDLILNRSQYDHLDHGRTGVLNATADIGGTRNDPVVQSDFAVTGGTVEGVKFNALTGKASYSGRAVDVDARLEQTTAAVLTAVGTIPVPNGPGGGSLRERRRGQAR